MRESLKQGSKGAERLAKELDAASTEIKTLLGEGGPVAQGGLLRTLNARAVQLAQQGGAIGQNATKTRTISTGRLRGFTATDTNLPGGVNSAQALFQTLVGRAPSGATDRAVANGLEVGFRAAGKSGQPKLQIVNSAAQTLEKITFLP